MASFTNRNLRHTVVLCAAILLSADAASAQGRHARISGDLAERLKASDALTDALEPAIRSDGLE